MAQSLPSNTAAVSSLEDAMAITHARTREEILDANSTDESETVLEEVIDTSLNPDRAHHDELGRTTEPHEDREQPASPREQPAAPLDVSQTGD
jgi:hypothetical protein